MNEDPLLGQVREDLFLFWGKAGPEGSLDRHPALLHMLDVAVVANELVACQPPTIKSRLTSSLGSSGSKGLALIAALHDIGKISPGFQEKREDLTVSLRNRGFVFPRRSESVHGRIAAWSLPAILEEEFGCPETPAMVFSQIAAAHHGVFQVGGPVETGNGRWDQARRELAQFLAGCLGVVSLRDISLPCTSDALIFGGLLTMADWLASSEENFPFVSGMPASIPRYLEERRAIAIRLVRSLGLETTVNSDKSFAELFPFSPNPCQEAALKVASRLQHPMLLVVESPMGSGKTEAAQAVYSKIASSGALRGIYYALPTQATGNAMLTRMAAFLERLDFSGRAQLHLVHANADLNPDYEALGIRAIEELGDGVVASSWFTARKRGILSSYATGTIDQALMAVLKVRHFFLRLFGLSGKLVVFDEVHAYDAYMTEEIRTLIGWLGQCRSSVVLLSATLPKKKRQGLLKAFGSAASVPEDIVYPCVLGVDSTGTAAWEEIRGDITTTLTFIPVVAASSEKAESIAAILRDKLQGGGCAACILNTVSEAQAVYELLKDEYDKEILLFHSRFTLERRLEIEKEILGKYGVKGSRPALGVVIATQVIEQSLDVDFDLMVSDLAPIDLLLQRAGRLHRHQRPRPSRLSSRSLHVLLPDMKSKVPDFGGSQYVYFPDILVRSAHLLRDGDGCRPLTVELPLGVSPLVESVYGEEEAPRPNENGGALDKWVEERLGTVLAQRFAAGEILLQQADLCFDDPEYLLSLANDEDEERMAVSRLARENVTLVILDEKDPLAAQGKTEVRKLYARSLVTDRREIVLHYRNKELPKEWEKIPLLRHCKPLVLRGGQTRIGGLQVSYDERFGLRIGRDGEAGG